jgi:hypothetical protein
MIPQKLQIVLIVAIILYFIIILKFLKDKALELKYTLLWLFAGAVMLFMVAFPELLEFVVHLFGIQSNMNGLYILLIGFILMILMTLTSIVSRQTNKTRTLIQEIAILEKRVRELEEKK